MKKTFILAPLLAFTVYLEKSQGILLITVMTLVLKSSAAQCVHVNNKRMPKCVCLEPLSVCLEIQ